MGIAHIVFINEVLDITDMILEMYS